MSESKRFKRNYKIDGWPIEDTKDGGAFNLHELATILNSYEDLTLSLEKKVESLELELKGKDSDG